MLKIPLSSFWIYNNFTNSEFHLYQKASILSIWSTNKTWIKMDPGLQLFLKQTTNFGF